MQMESEDRSAELMALARLVAFALESAKPLEADAVEYHLDAALRAVLDQIDEKARMALTSTDIMLMSRLPLC